VFLHRPPRAVVFLGAGQLSQQSVGLAGEEFGVLLDDAAGVGPVFGLDKGQNGIQKFLWIELALAVKKAHYSLLYRAALRGPASCPVSSLEFRVSS